MSLLDRITERRPLLDHDGRSGAALERGVLDGSTPVYVKTALVTDDIGALLTGDARRELRLWRSGAFDRLPAGVGTAIVGIEDLGDRLVTVTRDLGGAMLGWERTLTRSELRRIFSGVTAVHERFADAVPDGLCPLPRRLGLFAPSEHDALAAANPELAQAVGRGRDLLDELLPADLADVVSACWTDPEPLARAMCPDGATLAHGDFALVNVALDGDEVVPLDWGLATAGPPTLDLVGFCLSATSNVTLDREALVSEARAACRGLVDDDAFRAAAVWALLELGWNKALDAIDHPDPAKRAMERADLDFWVARAREALDAGSLTPAA